MLTADGIEKYSKNMLNSYYLQDWVVDKIKEQLPIEVINKQVPISEKKLRKYFPSDYTEEDMRSVIVELLEQWSQGKEQD